MLQFVKASAASERKRLSALLQKQEAHIYREFVVFARASTDAKAIKQVRQLLEKNNVEGALRLVDVHIQRLASSLATSFVNVGNAEATAWSSSLGVAVSFDQTTERAVALMQKNRLDFLSQFTGAQRTATRAALIAGMRAGVRGAALARQFHESIGLTPFYQQQVEAYRGVLGRGQAGAALERDLRDRRFDSTVANAVEDGLSPAQIERMVERYRQNMVRYRAKKIAATESLRVLGQAQWEMLTQTLEQTGIARSRVVKEWVANDDGKERQSHNRAHHQRRRLDEPFGVGSSRLMFPGDTSLGASADERIGCRCVAVYHTATDEAEVAGLLRG